MKNINGFDVVKYLLSYWVIAIHCNLNGYSDIGKKIADMAVPVYFVISGYLMFNSLYGKGDFKRYIKRLLNMYFLYTLIYFPLTLIGVKDMTLGEAVISIIQGTFIIGENYASWPLWYLWAFICGALIIKLLMKLKVSLEGYVILGFVLVLLARAMDALHPFVEALPSKADSMLITGYFETFLTTRNGLFVGLPYLSIGLLLRKYNSTLQEYRYVTLFICGLFFASAYFCRVPYASQLLAATIVLMILKTSLKDKSFYMSLRNLSTLIYFLHMYVVWGIGCIYPKMNFLYKWGCVSVLITLISLSLLFISRKYRKWEILYK